MALRANTAPLRSTQVELRHYRYFIAVAEELHFGRAARRLHIAQPPLSQQIKWLEEELGVQLLLRNTHRVNLTEAGRIFLKESRRVLTDVERSVRMARQAAEGLAGRLSIGFVAIADGGLVSRLKSVLSQEYPELEIHFLPLTAVEQIAGLRDGRIQAGIVAAPMAEDDLVVEGLIQSPIAVVLPERHSLLAKQVLRLSDLAGEPLIGFSAAVNPWIHRHFLESCRLAGFTPNVVQETTSPLSIIGFVAGGLGLGILPAWVKIDRKGAVYRPLRDGDFPVQMALAYLKGLDSPLLRQLRTVLEAELRRAADQVEW
jgi:DNA-binding transcriptional LysR family regulator